MISGAVSKAAAGSHEDMHKRVMGKVAVAGAVGLVAMARRLPTHHVVEGHVVEGGAR